MKKLLVLIFSMLISFNSYGETFCLETDFELKDGLIHLKNEVKPFSGKFLCEDDDGEDLWKGSINNGKRDGKWTTWYDNGEKKEESNYKDGKLDDPEYPIYPGMIIPGVKIDPYADEK